MQDAYGDLLTSIYDSAVDVDMWPQTLTKIQEFFSARLVVFASMDARHVAEGIIPKETTIYSPWDHPRSNEWKDAISQLQRTRQIPDFDKMLVREIDDPTSNMSHIDERDFVKSSFHKNWMQPFGLRDSMNINLIKRNDMMAVMGLVSGTDRELFDEVDFALMRQLSPHLRRAALINDMWRANQSVAALQRSLLDQLSSAVFIVRKSARVIYVNAAAELLLSSGKLLVSRSGVLSGSAPNLGISKLMTAIEVACENANGLERRGIGVPLRSSTGELAAAYVLPLQGDGVRGTLDQNAVAVFVSQRGDQQPVMMEILCTVFNLTPTEASVAGLVALGKSSQGVAADLDISINTVHTHLSRIFTKTGTKGQVGLARVVTELLPPITGAANAEVVVSKNI